MATIPEEPDHQAGPVAESSRKRRRRTFTLADEAYDTLTASRKPRARSQWVAPLGGVGC